MKSNQTTNNEDENNENISNKDKPENNERKEIQTVYLNSI